MSQNWETHVDRWLSANLIDVETAQRIRHFERQQARPAVLQWPVLLALVFGALLLGAGVLLFVSAHWDELSPSQRMALVVTMTGAFHVGGAFTASRFPALSVALHTTGTIALGGAIALAGQIFHLAEHWPAAILMWAAGAAVAWALLGHWTQGVLTAILTPYWLGGEWAVRMMHQQSQYMLPVWAGVCALSLVYLGCRRGPEDSASRRALGWVGGLALLPVTTILAMERVRSAPSWQLQSPAWAVAILVPLAVAFLLRRRDAVWSAIAILWVVLLAAASGAQAERLLIYLCCAAGAAGLAAWGIFESRAERINLGIAGFALTVMAFYFSSVMDKLGRSASLIMLGVLFLGGGWILERTRRGLIARIHPEAI